MGQGIKQSAGNMARQIAKNVRDESNEILKEVEKQVLPSYTEASEVKSEDNPQQNDVNNIHSQRMLQALEAEMKDIREQRERKILEEKKREEEEKQNKPQVVEEPVTQSKKTQARIRAGARKLKSSMTSLFKQRNATQTETRNSSVG